MTPLISKTGAIRPLVAALALSGAAIALPARADQLVDVRFAPDPGASERLEAADRLRTLSHEVASAACHLAGGIAPDQSRKLMIEAKEDFIQITAALRHGDESLKILGEETDRVILEDLDTLDAEWAVTEAAVRVLMEDPSDSAALATIKAESELLYATSDHLLSELSGEYSNPVDLMQVDAILMDIVGRQAMLTQKMAKEACEIWTGNRSDDRVTALIESKDMFELGIRALHDGMPSLSIPPAPTPGIRYALEGVLADWSIVQGHMELVKAGTIGEVEKEELYALLNKKMYELEDIVHLYVAFSKHDYEANGG